MPEVKKVLVTGSTGYIGKYVADKLKAHGYDVIYGTRRLWLAGHVDYIVHCAGVKPSNDKTVDDYLHGNVKYMRLVLNYAEGAGIKKFIYLSTHVAYHPDEYKLPGYSATKFLGEVMLKEKNIPFDILRIERTENNEQLFYVYCQILRLL